ncbi:MAG: choice-of-anchor H family protein [Gammaproteobacteria bacterium]|nr:choice-of-anchor H family protein [Gammaproteobacteria bacterium]
MNTTTRIGFAGLLCAISLNGFAQSDEVLVSRSVGKLVEDDSIVLREEVKSQELVTSTASDTSIVEDDTLSRTANRYDQYFTIYQGDVDLLSDLDRDGFHHALNVSFDVDVDYDGATVYAKLYLSREGGPWIQYHTTGLFNIFENNASDTYEVTTELIDGYFTGYYAVLVEIYSLNHAGMVASEILDHHNLGKDVMLEDLGRDEVLYYEEVEVTTVTYGVGSFSLFIWLLLVQVVIAARGILSLSPRKTIIKRTDTSALRSFMLSKLPVPDSTR